MQTNPISEIRASQTEDVYERLRAAILAGKFLPNQKLKNGELCKELGGSLGAVREALSRLLSDGLVVSQAFKGFRVAPVSQDDLLHLTEARIATEQLCLAASLRNGDVEWEGRLVALLHQLTRFSPIDDDPAVRDEWCRLHAAFHDALVSACPNPWLLRAHRMFQDQSERYRRLALMFDSDGDRRGHYHAARNTEAEHQRLVEAALARDVALVGDLIADHLNKTTNYLLAKLRASEARGFQGERIAQPVEVAIGR